MTKKTVRRSKITHKKNTPSIIFPLIVTALVLVGISVFLAIQYGNGPLSSLITKPQIFPIIGSALEDEELNFQKKVTIVDKKILDRDGNVSQTNAEVSKKVEDKKINLDAVSGDTLAKEQAKTDVQKKLVEAGIVVKDPNANTQKTAQEVCLTDFNGNSTGNAWDTTSNKCVYKPLISPAPTQSTAPTSGMCSTNGAPVLKDTWVSTGYGLNDDGSSCSGSACPQRQCLRCTGDPKNQFDRTDSRTCYAVFSAGLPLVLPTGGGKHYTGRDEPISSCFSKQDSGLVQVGVGYSSGDSVCTPDGRMSSLNDSTVKAKLDSYCASLVAGQVYKDGKCVSGLNADQIYTDRERQKALDAAAAAAAALAAENKPPLHKCENTAKCSKSECQKLVDDRSGGTCQIIQGTSAYGYVPAGSGITSISYNTGVSAGRPSSFSRPDSFTGGLSDVTYAGEFACETARRVGEKCQLVSENSSTGEKQYKIFIDKPFVTFNFESTANNNQSSSLPVNPGVVANRNITTCSNEVDCVRSCGGLYVTVDTQMPGDSRAKEKSFCGSEQDVTAYLKDIGAKIPDIKTLEAVTPPAVIVNAENAGSTCASASTSDAKAKGTKCSEYCPDYNGDGIGEAIALGGNAYKCASPGQNGDPAPRTLLPGSDCSEGGNDACASGICRNAVNPLDDVKGKYCMADTNLNTQSVVDSSGTLKQANGSYCNGNNDRCASGFCQINPTIFVRDRCADNPFVDPSTIKINRTSEQQQIENNQEKYKLIIAKDPKAFIGLEMSGEECDRLYEKNTPNVTDCIPLPGKVDRYVVRSEINDRMNELGLKKLEGSHVLDPEDCESGKVASVGAYSEGKNYICKPSSFCPEQDFDKHVVCKENGETICGTGEPWKPGVVCFDDFGLNISSDPSGANTVVADSAVVSGASKGLYSPVQINDPIPDTFEVAMQNGELASVSINNRGSSVTQGTTMEYNGCAPATLLNIIKYLDLAKYDSDKENLNEILTKSNMYIDCSPELGCQSGADAILAVLENQYHLDGALENMDKNRITNTQDLTKINGILTYQGEVSDPGVNKGQEFGHNAALVCKDGRCESMDPYTGGGKPQECNVIDEHNLKCGTTTYTFSESPNDNGRPPAAYIIPTG